jgi:hypothetical protein
MALEDLIHEITTPFPSSPGVQVTTDVAETNTPIPAPSMTLTEGMDWEKELDMQRLLDTLSGFQPEIEDIDFSSALELQLGGWELPPPSEIEVF